MKRLLWLCIATMAVPCLPAQTAPRAEAIYALPNQLVVCRILSEPSAERPWRVYDFGDLSDELPGRIFILSADTTGHLESLVVMGREPQLDGTMLKVRAEIRFDSPGAAYTMTAPDALPFDSGPSVPYRPITLSQRADLRAIGAYLWNRRCRVQ